MVNCYVQNVQPVLMTTTLPMMMMMMTMQTRRILSNLAFKGWKMLCKNEFYKIFSSKNEMLKLEVEITKGLVTCPIRGSCCLAFSGCVLNRGYINTKKVL